MLQVLLWLSAGLVSRLCVLQVFLEAFLEVFLEVFRSTECCLEVTARLGGAGGLPGESSPQTFPGGGLELVPLRHI